MKKLKTALYRLFFPGIVPVLCSVFIGAALLALTFLYVGENSPLAYAAYLISTYGLIVACTALVPAAKRVKQWIRRNPYICRLFDEIPFRLRFFLHLSLGINLLYAGTNAFFGIFYRSVWFGTLATYYTFLSIMRYSLVRHVPQDELSINEVLELKRCRWCGIMLILMNMALAGVIILVLHQNESFAYAGSLIYAMALYTFYITIMAVVNLLRYRNRYSPVISAARAVNLAAALVSMLSLEIAMLTQFSGQNDSPFFRQLMIGTTGGAACVFIAGMGAYMAISASQKLKSRNQI